MTHPLRVDPPARTPWRASPHEYVKLHPLPEGGMGIACGRCKRVLTYEQWCDPCPGTPKASPEPRSGDAG